MMGDVRRFVLLVVAAAAVLAPAHRVSAAEPSGEDSAVTSTTIDNSFLETDRDLTECLNNSIDLPNCGAAPEESGDRGGVLQGVTFGLLAVAIGLITWRVARSVRARDRALESQVS